VYERIPLGPGWSGTLTRLRLYPVPDAGAGDPTFAVAELRLSPEAPPNAPSPADAGPRPPVQPDRGPAPIASDGGVDPIDLPPPGTPDVDGGAPADAESDHLGGGCGQTAPGVPGWPLLLLFAVAVAVPRRRRR
ncbi:MAG: hypothetical protein KC620_21710, partial [Myxococcales bacterium]|nr:hypothetical protein [Myxococcales bacterium]